MQKLFSTQFNLFLVHDVGLQKCTPIPAADKLTVLIAVGSGGILTVIAILATITCYLVLHKKRVNMQ